MRGDRLPLFEGNVATSNAWFSLYEHAAGACLAVVVRPASDDVIDDVRRAIGRVDGRTLTIEARSGPATDVGPAQGWPAGSDTALDVEVDAPVIDLYGGSGTVLVAGPDLRVVAVGTGSGVVDQLEAPEPGTVRRQATPVAVVPDVVPPDLCGALIDWFDTHEHAPSGDVRVGQEGLDLAVKARRDHRLRDPELVARLTAAVVGRVLPEVARCFAAQPTSFEAYKIVRYDAGRGWFRSHRDNTTADAAHRRFALTLNLNDGYEGGNLVFPEFGRDEFRAPPGGAVVFSGNLLHAVTDVSAGARYAVLSFMW